MPYKAVKIRKWRYNNHLSAGTLKIRTQLFSMINKFRNYKEFIPDIDSFRVDFKRKKRLFDKMVRQDRRYALLNKFDYEQISMNDIFKLHKKFNAKDKSIIEKVGQFNPDELMDYFMKLQKGNSNQTDLNISDLQNANLWEEYHNKFDIENYTLDLNGTKKSNSLFHCLKGCKPFTRGYNVLACKYALANFPKQFGELLVLSNKLDVACGIFPYTEKVNKLIRIPKLNSKMLSDISANRLLSVPNTFSSVRNKWVAAVFLEFLEKEKLLPENQFGFRKFRSPALLFSNLFLNLRQTADNISIGVLSLDLKNAFGAPHHDLIKNRLSKICAKNTFNFFCDELDDRKAVVIEKGMESRAESLVKRGVGQGAATSPVIFITYLNDLNKLTVNHPDIKLFIFADDILATVCGASVDEVKEKAKTFIHEAGAFLKQRGLELAYNKTGYLIIGKKRKQDFTINSEVTVQTDCKMKHLGLRLDCDMNVKNQICFLIDKFRKYRCLIRNIMIAGHTGQIKNLARSLLYGSLNYCYEIMPILEHKQYNQLANEIGKIIQDI